MAGLPHTKSEKRDAAVAWVFHGNVKEVAETTGIPDKTLYKWIKADWWPPLVDEARREHQELIESRLSTITDKVTKELIDRIENGDITPKYNPGTKEIEYIRVPVRAKELGHIAEKLGNQLRVIRNQPTELKAEATLDINGMIREFARVTDSNREKIVSEQ